MIGALLPKKGMNINNRSMTDIYLMVRQNEGV
jgi:hypothetical protein